MGNSKTSVRVIAACCIAATAFLSACDNATQPAQTGAAPASRESVVGKVIRFNPSGNSEVYRVSGWSKTEPEFTWSEGTSARLALPVTKDAAALTLKVTAAGFMGADLPFQPVEVFVNDQKVADWQVGNTAEHTATIPADLSKAGDVLNVEFRTPKATSPKALGQSEDPRILGIAVHYIAVAPSA